MLTAQAINQWCGIHGPGEPSTCSVNGLCCSGASPGSAFSTTVAKRFPHSLCPVNLAQPITAWGWWGSGCSGMLWALLQALALQSCCLEVFLPVSDACSTQRLCISFKDMVSVLSLSVSLSALQLINPLCIKGERAGEMVQHFLLFFIFIYLLCIQDSVCVYVCKPEDGTRPHYRWL